MVENLKQLDLSIFRKEAKFMYGVANMSQMPLTYCPEIAFWGRSNVGKSSIINSLLHRTKLVKVSKTPGRTREINFFSLLDTFYFVDLPGYGYAKVSKDKKALWNETVIEYLRLSKNLKRVYLLIDSRVGFKEIDFNIMDFLNYYGRSYQIIFTKVDKINREQQVLLCEEVQRIVAKNGACFPEAIMTSSVKKDKTSILDETIGMLNLKQAILSLVSIC
jgi:GTP-binding protein